MIVVVRMNNCEIFLGELVSDDVDTLTIDEVIKVFQRPTPLKDGTYYTSQIPILMNPFGINTKISLKKRDIMFYDIADDYYHLYHANSYPQLKASEDHKQKMVLKLYSGEDESSLQWDNEDRGEPIVPEEDQHKTVDQLLKELDSGVDSEDETVYNVVPNPKMLH